MFLIFLKISSQCIVYWIQFQNIHPFTYKKTLLHTFLLLASKIVESLQCILKTMFFFSQCIYLSSLCYNLCLDGRSILAFRAIYMDYWQKVLVKDHLELCTPNVLLEFSDLIVLLQVFLEKVFKISYFTNKIR